MQQKKRFQPITRSSCRRQQMLRCCEVDSILTESSDSCESGTIAVLHICMATFPSKSNWYLVRMNVKNILRYIGLRPAMSKFKYLIRGSLIIDMFLFFSVWQLEEWFKCRHIRRNVSSLSISLSRSVPTRMHSERYSVTVNVTNSWLLLFYIVVKRKTSSVYVSVTCVRAIIIR